ncbi:hypothetical protein EON65_48590 [archaeon]|nr:MAG: hypothetical protein EON65_48590 [archaeon]
MLLSNVAVHDCIGEISTQMHLNLNNIPCRNPFQFRTCHTTALQISSISKPKDSKHVKKSCFQRLFYLVKKLS